MPITVAGKEFLTSYFCEAISSKLGAHEFLEEMEEVELRLPLLVTPSLEFYSNYRVIVIDLLDEISSTFAKKIPKNFRQK